MDQKIGSFTIDEWCRYRRISRPKLYLLWKEGKGPRRLRAGARVTISREADDEWRREREAKSSPVRSRRLTGGLERCGVTIRTGSGRLAAGRGQLEHKRTAPTLRRATFRTSRLLDFASEKELVAQTGHRSDAGRW